VRSLPLDLKIILLTAKKVRKDQGGAILFDVYCTKDYYKVEAI